MRQQALGVLDRVVGPHPAALVTSRSPDPASTPSAPEWLASTAAAGFPVALVCMPFAAHHRPSLQVGLLASIVRRCGFPVSTFHVNVDFAARIGSELYAQLSEHRGHQLGDWLFSEAAFGADAPDQQHAFLSDFAVGEWVDHADELSRIRRTGAGEFVTGLADSIPWGDFRVVGFTSTFQQSVASFALARAIKARHPDVVCVFGGANFDGSMGEEYVRTTPVIDFAVTGEGDLALPALLRALAEGDDPAAVPGVLSRSDGAVARGPARPLLRDLDGLPTPDYDEYFRRVEEHRLLPVSARREVDLPFESARGCWWGEKHHCTFCGLNASGMAFRSKSADRVREELAQLTTRYRSFHLEAVDNILSMPLMNELFPEFARVGTDYRFFYEVKANLTRPQLATLARGGVSRIQPGIESLSSHVLDLMRKGVRGIQNVNTLRWAAYYGIEAAWNLLWGFPGETEADYRTQLALMPRLVHLPPPGGGGRIWIERFSPLYQVALDLAGDRLRPERSYGYVYPTRVDLQRIAYFFDYELPDTLPSSTVVFEQMSEVIKTWQGRWSEPEVPSLVFRSAPGFVQIDDARDQDQPGTYTLHDPLAAAYRHCSDRPRSVRRVADDLQLRIPHGELEAALGRLCDQGLMMRDGDLFLALALPATAGR